MLKHSLLDDMVLVGEILQTKDAAVESTGTRSLVIEVRIARKIYNKKLPMTIVESGSLERSTT